MVIVQRCIILKSLHSAWIYNGKSLMQGEKTGPKTEPRGAPNANVDRVDVFVLTVTHC